MVSLIMNGGPGMIALLLLGLVGLASAAWFAWRAEARVRRFLDSMSAAVTCATLVVLATDIMKTLFYVSAGEPPHKTAMLMRGIGESMSPLVLGFAMLSLMHLLTAIGQRRLDGRNA